MRIFEALSELRGKMAPRKRDGYTVRTFEFSAAIERRSDELAEVTDIPRGRNRLPQLLTAALWTFQWAIKGQAYSRTIIAVSDEERKLLSQVPRERILQSFIPPYQREKAKALFTTEKT
jgi:hypothetical protein